MGFTTHFNCKQIERHDFSHYLILDQSQIQQNSYGSRIRLSWVDFVQTISLQRGDAYLGLKSSRT